MTNQAQSKMPPWWDTLTFTHGPETEWFARAIFREACRAGKTIHWRCAPAHHSVDELDLRLVTEGFRLVLEHDDYPRTRRAKAQLHRVYVRGDGVAVVNREGTAVTLSTASLDDELSNRLANARQETRQRRARRSAR